MGHKKRDRWKHLPMPTQAEIDDAIAWLDAMQPEHDPVEPGFYVEDADGNDLGEEFCWEHANEIAATLEGAYVGSACHGETDGERWCAHKGCSKQLDTGTFTNCGIESVLGMTEDDPMRAGTCLYGLRRVGWSMTAGDARAALWMLHVDDHRATIAAAYHPHREDAP